MQKVDFRKLNNEEDDEMIGMRQALPVPPIPDNFDPSIPPMTGEEYLQHVLFEARKYPSVFTAKRVDPALLNKPCDPDMVSLKPALASSPLAPTLDWENEQIDKFTRLRNSVHDLRQKRTVQGQNMAQTVETCPSMDAPMPIWKTFLQEQKPLLSVVFSMRQEQLQRALRVLLNIYSTGDFRLEHGNWVYAICACLDHPLSREACGDLRDIARKCAAVRKDCANPQEEYVSMLNLIITLVVKYYKQHDLCDETT